MQDVSTTPRLLAAAIVFFCICGVLKADDAFQTFGESSTRIGVVDLDRAAGELGWMDDMRKDMEACGNQLQADMKKFSGMYSDQLKSIAHSEGVDVTHGSTTAPADLTRDAAAARQQLNQLHQKADQLYAGYRASLVAHYREALLPTIRQVAHDRKITLVLVRNENVLMAEPEIDITSAVIDAARTNRPTVTPVPLPRLEGPAEVSLPASPTTAPSAKP